MISRRRFLSIAGAAGGVGAAAVVSARILGGGDASSGGPPTIRYGAESCAGCGMVIDDPRFAAAWAVGRQGRHYDDIGCMVNDLLGRPAPAGAQLFVHDFQTEAWLPALEATFVVSTAIRSPMAYGIAAASGSAGADRLAAQYKARVQAWPALSSGPVKGHS